jgi:hypothetical protein
VQNWRALTEVLFRETAKKMADKCFEQTINMTFFYQPWEKSTIIFEMLKQVNGYKVMLRSHDFNGKNSGTAVRMTEQEPTARLILTEKHGQEERFVRSWCPRLTINSSGGEKLTHQRTEPRRMTNV